MQLSAQTDWIRCVYLAQYPRLPLCVLFYIQLIILWGGLSLYTCQLTRGIVLIVLSHTATETGQRFPLDCQSPLFHSPWSGRVSISSWGGGGLHILCNSDDCLNVTTCTYNSLLIWFYVMLWIYSVPIAMKFRYLLKFHNYSYHSTICAYRCHTTVYVIGTGYLMPGAISYWILVSR